jgi:hypothetical protein
MHEKFCIVSDFPDKLKVDERNRPHCEDGPSHRWRDGWSIYHLRGVVVTRQIVEQPQTLTIEQIRAEQNAEVRRLMIERRGWPWYLKTISARVLNQRRNDAESTEEALMDCAADGRVLVCSCPSTARVYALEVPNNVDTCRAAQAYLSGGLSERIISAS